MKLFGPVAPLIVKQGNFHIPDRVLKRIPERSGFRFCTAIIEICVVRPDTLVNKINLADLHIGRIVVYGYDIAMRVVVLQTMLDLICY